jgi:hypothetical protein
LSVVELPALSAALVLARARQRVAVVDAGEPRNAPAQHMHGFLSRDGFPPAELLRLAREEVRDRPHGVIGGTPEALAHAHLVRQWSDDVVLFTHDADLAEGDREALAARAIIVVDGPVARQVVEDYASPPSSSPMGASCLGLLSS